MSEFVKYVVVVFYVCRPLVPSGFGQRAVIAAFG
jgi:hypothetical protein